MSDTRSGSGTAGAFQTAVCAVGPELTEALRAQGPAGERALDLLLDAALILNHPERLRRPYELAKSCVRGALDSVLNNMAGEDFPGPRRAWQAVADSWGRHRQVTQEDLGCQCPKSRALMSWDFVAACRELWTARRTEVACTTVELAEVACTVRRGRMVEEPVVERGVLTAPIAIAKESLLISC